MGGRVLGGTTVQCQQKTTAYGDYRDYHDSWYLLNPSNPLTGGPDGTTYRLHTTGTGPIDQKNTDATQNFALYASASGGTPAVYGLGAMQMQTPLSCPKFNPATGHRSLSQHFRVLSRQGSEQ